MDREAVRNLILDRFADYAKGTISLLDLPDILADEIMLLDDPAIKIKQFTNWLRNNHCTPPRKILLAWADYLEFDTPICPDPDTIRFKDCIKCGNEFIRFDDPTSDTCIECES